MESMAAMELVTDRNTREPDAELTKAIVQKAAAKGLILLSCVLAREPIKFCLRKIKAVVWFSMSPMFSTSLSK